MMEFLQSSLWPLIAAVLGGLNIMQMFTIKEERKQKGFEADNTHIDGLKAIIELQAQEIQRLQERVEQLEQKLYKDDE